MEQYIQDKLDEIDKTRFPDNFTPTQMDIIENAFTDYHNHIVEKIEKHIRDKYNARQALCDRIRIRTKQLGKKTSGDHELFIVTDGKKVELNHLLTDIDKLLQDTNPKE